MVNFPSQTNIKKTKRSSIGKRDSSKERRRSSLTNTVIVRRTPSGNRIENNNQNVEEVIQQINDNKPPTSQASTSSSVNSRESRSNSTKTTASSKPKRASLAGKPPQSPSSKLQMARRRSMGKTTKTMTVSKNQSVSPKQRKSPKDKKKDKKKNKNSGEEKKLVLGENVIDYSKIPVSEVSELKLASFTTTETETTTTEATVTSGGLKNDASEVILQPVVQQEETTKYTDNTILIDDDMLGMMIGALGDKMRKYIPNLRAHKVTVDQLMHAEFDSNDYLKMGIDQNDVPVFMSHFNGGHELSKNNTVNDTTDFQTAVDITPEKIDPETTEFTTEFEFREDDSQNIETPVKNKLDETPEKVDDYESSEDEKENTTEINPEKRIPKTLAEKLIQDVEIEEIDTVELMETNLEAVEKLIKADENAMFQETPTPEQEKMTDNMTVENVRDVIINTADKLHEIAGNIDHADNLLRSEPEQVLIQNNAANLPNDKVPIDGVMDEIEQIQKLAKECIDLGTELENKVDEKMEAEEIKAAAVNQEEFITDCEMEEGEIQSNNNNCSVDEEEESGVDQGSTSLQTEESEEATSKDTHNTSSSSTASIDDIKKYALIFGTGALISVGMYKLLRR